MRCEHGVWIYEKDHGLRFLPPTPPRQRSNQLRRPLKRPCGSMIFSPSHNIQAAECQLQASGKSRMPKRRVHHSPQTVEKANSPGLATCNVQVGLRPRSSQSLDTRIFLPFAWKYARRVSSENKMAQDWYKHHAWPDPGLTLLGQISFMPQGPWP